ncbi:penicillin-binding protein 2 [Thiofilum flexile]|uniref:penicillin-binding protein 2 n=1 Tax=Thiofilum flexile TaxID=125627 RepID=UPI000365DB44|nr:penicillin-binding protein 2 [Thiofilum flexile]
MGERLSIKTERDEQQLFNSRAIIAALIVLLALTGIIARMYFLQVKQNAYYTNLSLQNYQHRIPIAPTRGQIYDRNGVLLADSKTKYVIQVVRDSVSDLNDDGKRNYSDIDILLGQLSGLVSISEKEQRLFMQQLRKTSRYQPTVLKENLTDVEVAKFAVNKPRFPGVDIEVRMERNYPYGKVASHVIGYVGRIDERDMKNLNRDEYAASTHIGKTGVEASHEDRLHGQTGYSLHEVDAHGQYKDLLDEKPPVGGQDLFLSIDMDLQLKAEDLLKNERGAVIAIDPTNGEVLAMASMPTFDPNLFVNGISHKDYTDLRDNPDRPLYNRALQSAYPPGSTIKPMVALGGLQEGVIWPSKTTYDPGFFQIPGNKHRYRCWKKSGHGAVGIDRAIAQSCDTFFYDMAYRMGVEKYSNFMRNYGFGQVTGIDLPSESPGLMPTPEWKQKRYKQIWYPGDTVNIGIGQGYWLATPLQLAHAVATTSMRGIRVKPRLLHAVRRVKNEPPEVLPPEYLPKVVLKNPHFWDLSINGMINVVNASYGTAKKVSQGISYTMAGKTGTAQVFGIAQNAKYDAKKLAKRLHDHALFVGFAPASNPKIALSVIIENGGGGSSVAAPVARAMMDEYLLPKPALDPNAPAGPPKPVATLVNNTKNSKQPRER